MSNETPAEILKWHLQAMKSREEGYRTEIDKNQHLLDATRKERQELEKFIYDKFERVVQR